MSTVSTKLYDMFWISVETNTNLGCEWGNQFTENCLFVKELAERVKFYGKNPGILTSQAFWEKIMGTTKACG